MELNTSLNKAHQQQRRAEALLRQRNFDECIECHMRATGLLADACKVTENTRTLESLQLQKEYHRKEIELVRKKKLLMEQYKKTNGAQKRRTSFSSNDEAQNQDKSLEAAIYRTIEVHDSLIDYLGKRNGGSDNDSLKSYSTSDTEEKDGSAPVRGLKHPKDDAQIIEELKLLSGQLRDSVQCLLTQLDDRNKELEDKNKELDSQKKEIENLRSRLHGLEVDKKSGSKGSSNSLRVATDSSGGTSPYVFSPGSEPSPDNNETRVLPQLAPLELPNFDFLSLIRSNTSN